jgi:zinc protease
MNDDPEAVGSHTLNRLIYGCSPLAEPVLGVAASLEQIKPEDLRVFHRSKYGPQNTILIVVGDAEYEKTVDIVMDSFSGWTNEGLSLRTPLKVHRQLEPRTEVVPMSKEQTTIYIGHLGVERRNQDFYALQVVDTILGGGPGFTSRIPKALRDNQGIAYSAYSDLTGSSGIYPGRFAAYVCTSPEHRDKAHRGLLLEIERMIEEGVSAEELEIAKDFLTGSFVFEFQGNSSIARYLLTSELFDLEKDYPNYYEKAIRAVTRSEAHRVARRYLDTVNYSTVFAGSV